jgi:hypothetical protein
MENPDTQQPREAIGAWDYFRDPNGDLYRVSLGLPPEVRKVEFVVPQSKTEFALRCLRMAAGLPEHGE